AWVNRTFNSKSLGISFPTPPGQPGLPELIGPFDNYDGRVRATQTVFDWSSVKRVRAAGAQADGSRAERGATVESAAQTAAAAYLRAARAAAVVAARRADSSIAAELVTLAEAQKRAGVSAALDVTRARTQLVTAQGLLIIARNELDRGRIALARALAIDPATPLELADTLTAGLGGADVPGDRQAALAAALAGRPDLRAEVARGAAATGSGRTGAGARALQGGRGRQHRGDRCAVQPDPCARHGHRRALRRRQRPRGPGPGGRRGQHPSLTQRTNGYTTYGDHHGTRDPGTGRRRAAHVGRGGRPCREP